MSPNISLFLCGDVMLGRGIDQILPHPGDARIYEPHLRSAMAYLELAEKANGPIQRPVDFSYVWGDALAELERVRPGARIVNLETSITTSAHPEPKGVNYKLNPANVPCLAAAKIDCCALANNHVLDWGAAGLLDTLDALAAGGIQCAGAGRNAKEAEAPAILGIHGGASRLLVFAFGSTSSGILPDWAAKPDRAGVNLVDEASAETVSRVVSQARALKRSGDILVASIHWGGNWGYDVPREQHNLAHQLIDEAGFDIVHGHSSHHAKAIEVHHEKLILYGCGDFINDYEGIGGYEGFRDDLAVMYIATLSRSNGALVDLTLTPFKIRRFRLDRAARADAAWLRDTLDRESTKFGVRLTLSSDDNTLAVLWH
jgi:poly-gamma-glutamate capsule biosynthesis protein CapA/YwtB (metallophosphatase superfamily)